MCDSNLTQSEKIKIISDDQELSMDFINGVRQAIQKPCFGKNDVELWELIRKKEQSIMQILNKSPDLVKELYEEGKVDSPNIENEIIKISSDGLNMALNINISK